MSLNKFMHPRNVYRQPPNFKQLAIEYPEFRHYAKQDLTGKISFDFKDRDALRVLTQVLLKRDFRLKVAVPENRLIPTLPLRLNYVLWIEDLVTGSENIHGIDIGTGASCIYPLLAARKNGWKMLATEVDSLSLEYAARNVTENELDQLIAVKSVPEEKILVDVVDPESAYDFCMCNPPFFSSEDELRPDSKSRSPSRNPPRNAHTGSTGELVAPGGEVSFVKRIIGDSFKLRTNIRIYTVMLGHKNSVGELLRKLKNTARDAGCIVSITTTEFCQGHTTRWGLAWSFDPKRNLSQKTKPIKASVKNKKKPPISLVLDEWTFTTAVEKIFLLLDKLQMIKQILKKANGLIAMEIKAMSNTWSHQRRNRRKMRQQMGNDNASAGETTVKNDTEAAGDEKSSSFEDESVKDNNRKANISAEVGSKRHLSNGCGDSESIGKRLKTENVSNDDDDDDDDDKAETLNVTDERLSEKSAEARKRLPPLIVATLIVRSTRSNVNSDDGSGDYDQLESVIVEMALEGGVGSWDLVHQIMQYFKNNLKKG